MSANNKEAALKVRAKAIIEELESATVPDIVLKQMKIANKAFSLLREIAASEAPATEPPPLPEPHYPQWSHSNEFAAYIGVQVVTYAQQYAAWKIAAIRSEQAPAGEWAIKTWQERAKERWPRTGLAFLREARKLETAEEEIADLRAALSTPPAVPHEPWMPYLVDRADGCKGRYAIARWHPDGYREVWNLRTHRWASASDDVLTLEQARELMRNLVIPTAPAVPPELIQIGQLIATQDNRYTDQPLFLVEQKRVIAGIDTAYTDQIAWVDSDSVLTSGEEFDQLEAAYRETHDEPEGWTRTGYHEQWEFVTACFTEQGCKDYIARNGHNMKEPRIYADGSYRNEEYRAIRNWLLSLSAAPAAPQTKEQP